MKLRGHLKYKIRTTTNAFGFQYDTISKMIFCVNNAGEWFFNSLNPHTGAVNTIDSIPGLNLFVGATAAFAQDSLKYFFVGVDDSSGLQHFYNINTSNGNIITNPILGNGNPTYDGTQYDPCNSGYCVNNYHEPICIVTIDTSINKCEIIWGRTDSPPATGSYNVYKESSSVYKLIHNQTLTALSEYIDTTSNPSAGPTSYELSTVDSCGESTLSIPNTTIFLTITSSLNVYILNWTPYVGYTPSKYRIFRGASMSSLTQLDSVPSSVLTFHDTLPPIGSIYLVEAVSPYSMCIPTTRIKPHNESYSLSGSYSNGYNTKTIAGVQNIYKRTSIKIYPDPILTESTISFGKNGIHYLELDDITGRELRTIECDGEQYELSRDGLSQGIYLLKVFDAQMEYETSLKLVVVQ